MRIFKFSNRFNFQISPVIHPKLRICTDRILNRYSVRYISAIILFFFFLLPERTAGQEKERMPVNIRANYHYGVMLPEYAFMNYLSEDYSSGFELNYAWQTTGKSIWEKLYRYPAFGIGFYYSTLSNEVTSSERV
ncbi:MAG: hypothetical protein FD123_3810 [Bacteroidetes bacterium]|nr:MAG: hypothetical protein FD123_3810 [Bacteroidota bacterium]